MPAININLLPVELSAKSGAAKLGSVLKKALVAILGATSVLGVLAGIFIVVLSFQLDDINKKNEAIKANISNLESTEQKTVLVRDRLSKIKTLGTSDAGAKSLAVLSTLTQALPGGANLADAVINSGGGLEFSFKVADSAVLPNILVSLVTNNNFGQLAIKSFSYSPSSGYTVSFESQIKQ